MVSSNSHENPWNLCGEGSVCGGLDTMGRGRHCSAGSGSGGMCRGGKGKGTGDGDHEALPAGGALYHPPYPGRGPAENACLHRLGEAAPAQAGDRQPHLPPTGRTDQGGGGGGPAGRRAGAAPPGPGPSHRDGHPGRGDHLCAPLDLSAGQRPVHLILVREKKWNFCLLFCLPPDTIIRTYEKGRSSGALGEARHTVPTNA